MHNSNIRSKDFVSDASAPFYSFVLVELFACPNFDSHICYCPMASTADEISTTMKRTADSVDSEVAVDAKRPRVDEQSASSSSAAASSTSASSSSTDLVDYGMNVVLRTHDGKWYTGRVDKKQPFKVGKYKIKPASLVGLRFGDFFQIVDKGTVVPHSHAVPSTERIGIVAEDAMFTDSSELKSRADNRNIKLLQTKEEIEAEKEKVIQLRAQGLSSEELVDKLVESRSNKDQRNAFELEKYKKRKASKYICMCQILWPTPSVVARCNFAKKGDKVGMLREDTLSLLLNRANVRAGSQCCVLEENTMSMVCAAVAYRLGGFGRVLRGTFGIQSDAGLMQMHNLDYLLPEPKPLPFDTEGQTEPRRKLPCYPFLFEDVLDALCAPSAQSLVDNEVPIVSYRSVRDLPPRERTLSYLRLGLDSLVIAQGHVPADNAKKRHHEIQDIRCLLTAMWPFLAPGASFALYSPTIEPLGELLACLRQSQQLRSDGSSKFPIAVRTMLTEVFSRDFQILPNRSHPEMSTQLPSGYILSGIKVQPAPEELDGADPASVHDAFTIPQPLQRFWAMMSDVPLSEVVPLDWSGEVAAAADVSAYVPREIDVMNARKNKEEVDRLREQRIAQTESQQPDAAMQQA
jgi:tRNA (adenine-N(1)-)-methyltransferase non-catalytic subunit